MAYSNVTPPPLPEYDSDTYGFYLLVFNYRKDAEDWYMVHLIYSAWRFQYEEGVGVTNTAVTFIRTYSDGSWTEEMQNTETLALNPGMNGVVYQRIYTNANIFNGDEIWLSENSVTPVETEKFPIKDFLNGLIMALCGRAVQYPKREPVAYLYNGVGPLPDIYTVYTPELQKLYPFVFINLLDIGAIKRATLYCLPELGYNYANNNWCINLSGLTYLTASVKIGGSEWGSFSEESGGTGFVVSNLEDGWANFDVRNENGSVYLAASDPVPVYE